MHEPAITLDKLDGQILHALQVWPRVSWSQLGALLNVDPATASRHWARLQQAGVVRLSSYARPSSQLYLNNGVPNLYSVVIELQVQPAKLTQVFEQLEHLDGVMILRATLGEWNISLNWQGKSLDELTPFINERIATIDGVVFTRSFAVTQVPIEGSSWRYQGLCEGTEQQLRKMLKEDLYDPLPFNETHHKIDDEIVKLIAEDPRMSYTQMAKRTNSVVGTVKRHLAHLLRNRDLVIRCDISRRFSAKPVTVRYFASIPATEMNEIFAKLSDIRDIRSCSVLLGRYNLMLNVWLESIFESTKFEAMLARQIPAIRIRERDLVTRFGKLSGHRIGLDGLYATEDD